VYILLKGLAMESATDMAEMSAPDEETNPRMPSSGGSGTGGGRGLLLAWDVRSDGEEPWRRLLQELSEPHWQEQHVAACRRLGISVESIWFVPKMGGGGTAVVYLEAEDPERTLRELVASETLLESWGIGGMGRFFGFGFSLDSAQASRVVAGELLFSWRDGVPDER
jgi:hypothetical protein